MENNNHQATPLTAEPGKPDEGTGEPEDISPTIPEQESPPIAKEKEQYAKDVRKRVLRVQHLIMYAAEKGKPIDDETCTFILEFAHKVLDGGEWSTADEAKFWAKTCELSQVLAPVTYETLTTSQQSAKKYVYVFGILTIVLLMILVYAQFVWVVLNNVTRNIEATIKGKNEAEIALTALNYRLEEYKNQLKSADAPTAVLNKDEAKPQTRRDELISTIESRNKEREEASKKIDEATNQLRSSLRILESWLPFKGWLTTSRPPDPGIFDSDAKKKKKMDAIKDWEAQREEESSFRDPALRTWAKQILQGMSAYILPMIYGLVGSCAFVLRTMSRQIRDLTFSSEGAIQYMLRLVLGALAGISIGWFLSPNSNNLDIASSISPLALAFVAGYSVELVFMAMDRVITAFTEKSASQSGTQSPAGTVT